MSCGDAQWPDAAAAAARAMESDELRVYWQQPHFVERDLYDGGPLRVAAVEQPERAEVFSSWCLARRGGWVSCYDRRVGRNRLPKQPLAQVVLPLDSRSRMPESSRSALATTTVRAKCPIYRGVPAGGQLGTRVREVVLPRLAAAVGCDGKG